MLQSVYEGEGRQREQESLNAEVTFVISNRDTYNLRRIRNGEGKLNPNAPTPIVAGEKISLYYECHNQEIKIELAVLPTGLNLVNGDPKLSTEDGKSSVGFFGIEIDKNLPISTKFEVPIIISEKGKTVTRKFSFIVIREVMENRPKQATLVSVLDEIGSEPRSLTEEGWARKETALDSVTAQLQAIQEIIQLGELNLPYLFFDDSQRRQLKSLNAVEQFNKLFKLLEAFKALSPELKVDVAQSNSSSKESDFPLATIYRSLCQNLEALTSIAQYWKISLRASRDRDSVRTVSGSPGVLEPHIFFDKEQLTSYVTFLGDTLNGFKENLRKYNMLLEPKTFTAAQTIFEGVAELSEQKEFSGALARKIFKLCQHLEEFIELGSRVWLESSGQIQTKEIPPNPQKSNNEAYAQMAKQITSLLDGLSKALVSNKVNVADLQELYTKLSELEGMCKVVAFIDLQRALARSIEVFLQHTQTSPSIEALVELQAMMSETRVLRGELKSKEPLPESDTPSYESTNQKVTKRVAKYISDPEKYVDAELRQLLADLLSQDFAKDLSYAEQVALFNYRVSLLSERLVKVEEYQRRELSVKEWPSEPLHRRNLRTKGLRLKCLIDGGRPGRTLVVLYHLKFRDRDAISVRDRATLEESGSFRSNIESVETDEVDKDGKKVVISEPDIDVIAKTYRTPEDEAIDNYEQKVVFSTLPPAPKPEPTMTLELPVVQTEEVVTK